MNSTRKRTFSWKSCAQKQTARLSSFFSTNSITFRLTSLPKSVRLVLLVFCCCSFCASTKVAFSLNVDTINDENNQLNKYVFESLKGFDTQIIDPFYKV